jgi:type I restriction enzyme S subunit
MFELKLLHDAVRSHIGGGTPSRQVPSYWGGGIPWASVKDFNENASTISATEETISQSGLNSSASNLIPAGTPLVCTRMAVGRAAMPLVPMSINQDVKALFPAEGVSPAYLLRLIHFIRPKADAQAVGSTVKGIRIQDYLDIPVPLAPNEVQPVIATILDTLDTTIRQTEAIIAKLQQVKQGLLHDLLTRGIDANGRLRPPVEVAPHLYKESPLGRIPKEWEVKTINAACEHVVDCPHSTPNFLNDGMLAARTMHIKAGEFLVAEASRVSEKEYHERIARLEPCAGDIIFTREAPVGEAFVIPKGMKICLGQRVMLLRPRPDVLYPDFLVAQIYSGSVMERIAALTAGTTNPHLNVSEVKSFELPLPPYEEQSAIGGKIESLTHRLSEELVSLAKLNKSKSGLMDDLLTGRVRVTNLLNTCHQSL